MFSCSSCGGHYGSTDLCDDCGVCVACCYPDCACDGCLSNREDA